GLTAHGLRQALAKDIAALRGVATPDTQGIYLELSALAGQVKHLHQNLPKFEPEAVAPPVSSEQQTLTAQMLAVFNNAGSRLASLVDFRRDGIEIQPILPPREVYYLRQNLVLKIQLAQLALLDGNEVAYGQALTEAAAWVTNSFGDQDATASSMQRALLRLSLEKIAVVLPDISGSLREARRHLAAAHHREVDEPPESRDVSIDAQAPDNKLGASQKPENKTENRLESAESAAGGPLAVPEAAADTSVLETQQE
ncbi:MAG: uroporphyrin-3 C-methyltransferase, partial [Candidatus Azotimanducaceae bacterium]